MWWARSGRPTGGRPKGKGPAPRKSLPAARLQRVGGQARPDYTEIVSLPAGIEPATADRLGGLDPETLIRAFRIMHLSRRLDEREIALKRQNRIFFQVS